MAARPGGPRSAPLRGGRCRRPGGTAHLHRSGVLARGQRRSCLFAGRDSAGHPRQRLDPERGAHRGEGRRRHRERAQRERAAQRPDERGPEAGTGRPRLQHARRGQQRPSFASALRYRPAPVHCGRGPRGRRAERHRALRDLPCGGPGAGRHPSAGIRIPGRARRAAAADPGAREFRPSLPGGRLRRGARRGIVGPDRGAQRHARLLQRARDRGGHLGQRARDPFRRRAHAAARPRGRRRSRPTGVGTTARGVRAGLRGPLRRRVGRRPRGGRGRYVRCLQGHGDAGLDRTPGDRRRLPADRTADSHSVPRSGLRVAAPFPRRDRAVRRHRERSRRGGSRRGILGEPGGRSGRAPSTSGCGSGTASTPCSAIRATASSSSRAASCCSPGPPAAAGRTARPIRSSPSSFRVCLRAPR